ncbi:3-phenylpropionate MFS transporter [Planococcus lenghuensis]|uniref:3-phenylpropionic acid transporter n=1 Tax=Planococcus lenghuensis TaxID=2213202 RepID=A0A1Q2KV67_9BACL|nr:3-phenylpropionate MFS transporter [Planococcus lenghuensis]AQQ52115.1 3-phenylpropionic acid transporter [Planococcus lenghuensis]
MDNQKWLSQNFFAFFFTWGVFLPYWTGWLTNDKGLSVVDASVIMGAGMVARAVSTLVLFPLATRYLPLSNVLRWFVALSLASFIFYLFFDTYTALFVITVVFNLFYPNLLPATESGASILMQAERVNYGHSRSFGSLGYTIALLLVGGAVAVWQEEAILWLMFGGLILMAAVQFQRAPAVLLTSPSLERSGNYALAELIRRPVFLIALSAAVLLQGAHASYYNYGFIYLQDLGVSGIYIGVILNIAVLIEILFFAKADSLFAKWSISSMFLLAGIGSIVRWLMIFLFPSVWVFILSQTLHAVSFGVAHFAFIRFIFRELPARHIPAAQGLYAAFAMSLSIALLTFLGGYLYEWSPGLAFLGMAVFSSPAVLIVLCFRSQLDARGD